MRNKLLVYVLLLVVAFNAYGQVNEDILNNFKEKPLEAENDSTRLWFATELTIGYRFSNIDSSFHYNDIAIKLITKINSLPEAKNLQGFMPKVSIGIKSGEMISGNIGSVTLKRLDYTVIGDTVNTAARFQDAAKKKPDYYF